MYSIYIKKESNWSEQSEVLEEWIEDQKYSYHYVAFSIPGLTYAASYFDKIKSLDYKQLFFTINHKNEAGSLFPMYNATFLPVHKANYHMETVIHRESTSDDDLRGYFKDVEKSNTMMGTDTIVLDLRDFDLIIVRASIRDLALDELSGSQLINRIIVLT